MTPATFAPSLDSALTRAIEPLAEYVCAADRPQEALRSALRTLLREIEQTNSAATNFLRDAGHQTAG
jgi:hypothetical protein